MWRQADWLAVPRLLLGESLFEQSQVQSGLLQTCMILFPFPPTPEPHSWAFQHDLGLTNELDFGQEVGAPRSSRIEYFMTYCNQYDACRE